MEIPSQITLSIKLYKLTAGKYKSTTMIFDHFNLRMNFDDGTKVKAIADGSSGLSPLGIMFTTALPSTDGLNLRAI